MENINLIITGSCPKENIEIIKYYWDINKVSLQFENKPKIVAKKFNLYTTQTKKIIENYSKLTFYHYCKNCISYEFQEFRSQTAFNKYKNKHSNAEKFENLYKCENCKLEEDIERKKQNEQKGKELYARFNKAIDEKRWLNLDTFQRDLLVRCIEEDFSRIKRYYWQSLGEKEYYKLFKELEFLASLDLILLQKKEDGRINDYEILKRLRKEFEYLSEQKPLIKEKTHLNFTPSDQIRFKLTIDNTRKNPDSPKYSGTVTFKQRIVIEPGIEYSFAQWERSGDNLYFVLIPTKDIYPVPNQKPINRLPTWLQDGIRDFMNNLKPE